jgi:hypothetical protein
MGNQPAQPLEGPVSFAAVSVMLLAAGLQACCAPARRAARVDPIVALRRESLPAPPSRSRHRHAYTIRP